MRKFKKCIKTAVAIALVAMVIPTQVRAATVPQASMQKDRNQIDRSMSVRSVVDLSSFNDVSSVPMSNMVNPDEVISVSDKEVAQARKGISTKYGWDYGTAPYTFTQKWSTNQEIYGTYPFYDDGLFYPAATELLDDPSISDYSTAVREGYVNDSWATGTELGLHTYYHTVPVGDKLNSITVLLDQNVGFQVYDMNLDPILSTDSPAYDNLISYYKMAVNHNGSHKDVHTLKLLPGNYFIMFGAAEGTGNFHYAMFTGNPLPIEQSYLVGGTHNGSVKWDGYSSSQTYQCPGVSISISDGAELFALSRVTFNDMGTAVNNAYVSSVNMMYQSPNSYSYKTVANMAGLKEDMIDNFPDAGSIVGTYNTKVTVNWMPNLSYVNASYFTNTMLNIDYLVPLGEVKVSF